MQTTLIALLAAAGYLAISGESDMRTGPYVALFASVAIAAAIVTLLPWKRLFDAGLGTGTQYAWSAVNILLITLGIWVTGGGRSYLFFLYALTTVFFAVSFPPRVQWAFLAFTFLCYGAVMGVTGWDAMSLAFLGILAFLASFLSRELKRQMAAHGEARVESERRWDLVATVAAAARNMSTVDSRGVLEAVVDAIVALGFETARIYVRDDELATYRAVLPRGLTGDFSRGFDSLPAVVRGTVLKDGRTLVIGGDGGDPEATRILTPLGLKSMVAIPILVADRAEAVLIVGSSDGPGPSPQELEIFRMLGAQASLALENARRFEAQGRDMERLAELDRLKRDFISTVSHELRTPLTVITGMGLTLEQQWSSLDDELRRELLTRLNANATSLNEIITKLLDFSRFEAGRLEVHAQEVELENLLTGVAGRLDILFLEHALEIAVEEGLVIEADPVLLERIVENLLSNAAKHTPAGTRVELSAGREGAEAIIAVRDDGPGIPPDELEHLGERFFRGGDTNTRSTRGTGLGLALVSEILKLHGCDLEIQSERGLGSRFAFRLPLVKRALSAGNGHATNRSDLSLNAKSLVSAVGARGGQGIVLEERFETVLTAARMGAHWAVAALHRELNPRLLRYLRALLPAQEAENLASELWMEMASGLGGFDGDRAAFRRWGFSIARRRLLDRRHQLAGEPHVLGSADLPSPLPDGRAHEQRDGDPVAGEERVEIEEALARIASLPPEEAEVVFLRVLGDLSAEEVAAITGKRVGAVRVLQLQGVERLGEVNLPDEEPRDVHDV
jgi:RNA polymerase sigma factor (sigma-70 family)